MKYIIIGAVAGGATAAARLRRLDEHAEIVMFEKGEYISYSNCGLPYYIGDVIKERNALLIQTAASFNLRYKIDVRTTTEITAINASAKTVTAKNHITGKEVEEKYDKLVLSPGADPIRPPLPGITENGIFTLRNVKDSDTIKEFAQQNHVKKAIIIGGGFIGLEMAENFHNLGMEVTIIEMGNQILAPLDFPLAAIIQQHIRSKGVDLLLNSTVTAFEKNNDKLKILLKSGEELSADIVILSIGVKPDTRLAIKAGLKIGEAKGIWVNEFLQTSNPDIYAVGDAIEFANPITKQSMNTYLAGPANKQARICADNIVSGNVEKYKGAINTAIVKVFDMTVATAGTAAKHLAKAGIQHTVSTTYGSSHAGYYPEAKQMSIQIAFSPVDGRLFNAQIAGYDGVDKRIDILSSIIKRNGTIYELEEFEHAYAPPYSSAKDPVNIVGFVAEDIIQDKLTIFYWNQINEISENDILLDVRSEEEFEKGFIPNAIHIPIDELRERMTELDPAKNIFIYCFGGIRGYLGQLILKQNGFKSVSNLSGGYQLWEICNKEIKLSRQPEIQTA